MKALQTVLNLGVGVKLTKEQVEELKVAVNQVTGKEKSTKDDNYRLRHENAELRTQLAKANESVKELDEEIQNIAASIGADATIEDICNILEGYDSVKQLRKDQNQC